MQYGRAHGRASGAEISPFEDNETSFPELHERIQRTSDYVESQVEVAFISIDGQTIDMKSGDDVVRLRPSEYLVRFALPNFHFHVTAACDILRHNGVVLGRRDYLGSKTAALSLTAARDSVIHWPMFRRASWLRFW